MKDVRIFVASSKELLPERNSLAYFVLAHVDEFAKRGLRVRLSKWEYVDPTITEERTEDRYLEGKRISDFFATPKFGAMKLEPISNCFMKSRNISVGSDVAIV